ncbi:MAG: hypothetical protein EUB_02989 [Eubacterium sp.]|uniref:SipW-dependent-type signal peptide-containing protein n=1 Tax=Eubacterium sp. TaxID=142586 RepID=UPI00304EDF9B
MTKKKKGALLISALALIAVIVIGGTLAYFTSQDTAQNVFTMGKVSGKLDEDTNDTPVDGHPVKPGTPSDDGLVYDKVMPGDWLSKIPTVSIDNDSEPAYVRVDIEVNATNGSVISQEIKDRILSDECLDINEKWVKGVDGKYYYQDILSNPDKATTEPLFTLVKFDGDKWGNELNGLSFTIDLTADIIQAENFDSSLGHNSQGKIDSWGNVEIKK